MYKVALDQSNRADELYKNGKLQEALNTYIKSISNFITLYKMEQKEEVRKQFQAKIYTLLDVAETIKVTLSLKSVPEVPTTTIVKQFADMAL